MRSITRRDFVSGSLAASAALRAPRARPLGASSDIRVACVGVRGQGRAHMNRFESLAGVRVVALCDVDPAVLASRADELEQKSGREIRRFSDVRHMLDLDDIDAVAIATPNHWHALMAIWACQAGKDVYVEKPVSHNVWEGRRLVDAARAHRRVVQGGTQSRSHSGIREAIAYVHAGELGAVRRVRGLCYKPRQSIGAAGRGKLPKGLDYDLWLGPAPRVPLRRANLHYDWHWVHDTGNGDMGNQGIHQMDVARWALGVDHLSPRVISIGGRLGYRDDGETPNTQVVWHGYEPAPLLFETRGLPKSAAFHSDGWGSNMDSPPGFNGRRGIGVVVECEHGSVVIDNGGARAYDADHAQLRAFSGSGNHYANFIEAVRARDPQRLNAEVLQTHLSSALCHTAMISHLLGQRMTAAEIAERVEQCPGLADRHAAMVEHLAANRVDVGGRSLTSGPLLRMDPASESFVGDHAANCLLSRHYREPFVVPSRP